MSTHPRLFSPYDAPMWDSIARGEMALQRCDDCGRFRYPPGPCCPHCLSLSSRWVPLSGRARVLSWTTFHRKYLPAYPPPTTVVAVVLEEGPIMLSNIDAADTARLVLDLPLVMFYDDHPDGYRLPRFRIEASVPAAGRTTVQPDA